MANQARKQLEDAILRALRILLDNSIEELTAQGHVASGQTINSLGVRIEPAGAFSLEGVIYGSKVLRFLDTGTKPHWPPVDAIKSWLLDKGVSPSEAEAAKWPISATIAKYGTPTPGSYEYSRNGRRTEWSTYALKASRNDIMKILTGGNWVRAIFREVIREHNKAA